MTTKRITFHADEASLAYLEKRQQETGASVSEIIRRALRKMDGPAPIETRTTQPALLLSRREEVR